MEAINTGEKQKGAQLNQIEWRGGRGLCLRGQRNSKNGKLKSRRALLFQQPTQGATEEKVWQGGGEAPYLRAY